MRTNKPRTRPAVRKGRADEKPPAAFPPHKHAPLAKGGYDLAEALARVAVRTLYAALAENPKVVDRVKGAGKYTKEFEALEGHRVPAEVRTWVRKQCWKADGVVMAAVRSQLELALWHAAGETKLKKAEYLGLPAHLQPQKYDKEWDPGEPGPDVGDPRNPSCCTPYCTP